jgi:hypothetical protein
MPRYALRSDQLRTKEARQGWAKSINTILETSVEELKVGEWLDAKLSTDDELDRRAIPTS